MLKDRNLWLYYEENTQEKMVIQGIILQTMWEIIRIWTIIEIMAVEKEYNVLEVYEAWVFENISNELFTGKLEGYC